MWLQPGGDRLRKKGLGKGITVSKNLTPGGRLACTTSGNDIFATHYHEYSMDNCWAGELMVKHALDKMLPIFETAFPSDRYHIPLWQGDKSLRHGG